MKSCAVIAVVLVLLEVTLVDSLGEFASKERV